MNLIFVRIKDIFLKEILEECSFLRVAMSQVPCLHEHLANAATMIQELIAKMPEIEVRGSLVPGKEEAVKGLGRISIKEKLAEKKAIIEQKDKSGKSVPEKDTEKKKQREM